MSKQFNNLTSAEAERLFLLAEECAETIQAVQKILRHGYESYNPFDSTKTTNRSLLEKELGHVAFAKWMLVDEQDVSGYNIEKHKIEKNKSIKQWLHHNE